MSTRKHKVSEPFFACQSDICLRLNNETCKITNDIPSPVTEKELYNTCTMLDQRRRRWAGVLQPLHKCDHNTRDLIRFHKGRLNLAVWSLTPGTDYHIHNTWPSKVQLK